MSNIYDHAHALARAVKESEEFKSLKTLQEQVNADPSTKTMLDDFRNKQMELQLKQMQGEEISEEEMDKTKKLFDLIQLNPTISRLLDVEQRFGVVMEDMNKIITEPLRDIYQQDNLRG